MRKIVPVVVGLFSLFLSACSESDRLDISPEKSLKNPLKIKRFDQDLFAINENNLKKQTSFLINKYGDFYEGFLSNVVCRLGTRDTAYPTEILRFVKDADMNQLYNESSKLYSDLSALEKSINNSATYFAHYFPDKVIPQPVAAFTGLNYSVVRADTLMAFSLDMYLGKNTKIYDMTELPIYRRAQMNPHNLLPDYLKGWMMSEFEGDYEFNNLLSAMIFHGKIIYLVDAMIHNQHDTLKIGFTEKQLDWCIRNEANMWGYLIKNKLLYSTEARDIAQFTNDGPFTNGFAKESPARTGVWLAWQIIKKYMNEHPDVTLDALMKEKDAQKILNESRYKP